MAALLEPSPAQYNFIKLIALVGFSYVTQEYIAFSYQVDKYIHCRVSNTQVVKIHYFITLSNIVRFPNFFHWCTLQKICNT